MTPPRKRELCGEKREYKTDGNGEMAVLSCDRLPKHAGEHRGRYRYMVGGEWWSETIYWPRSQR